MGVAGGAAPANMLQESPGPPAKGTEPQNKPQNLATNI